MKREVTIFEPQGLLTASISSIILVGDRIRERACAAPVLHKEVGLCRPKQNFNWKRAHLPVADLQLLLSLVGWGHLGGDLVGRRAGSVEKKHYGEIH